MLGGDTLSSGKDSSIVGIVVSDEGRGLGDLERSDGGGRVGVRARHGRDRFVLKGR